MWQVLASDNAIEGKDLIWTPLIPVCSGSSGTGQDDTLRIREIKVQELQIRAVQPHNQLIITSERSETAGSQRIRRDPELVEMILK